MNKKALITGVLSLALSAVSQAAVNYVGNTADSDVTTVINLASDPTGTYGGTYAPATATSRAVWSWSALDGLGNPNHWVLEEIVFITGGDLYIEPGTIVRGQPRTDSATYNPGALVISRGAKILAAGNSGAPIVFTSASSTGAAFGGRTSGQTPSYWDAAPLTAPQSPTTSGSWGGVLICGNAPTNVDRDGVGIQQFFDIHGAFTVSTDDRSSIEGIPTGTSANLGGYERFGGHAEADNSGILSYVSIRHGGANLSSNNEINGLTMGGVGRGTTVNYIEIWGNTDDGVEIFGGSVNLDHIVIVAPQDDGLDIDVGYSGTVQFLAVIASAATDKLGEWDGSYEGENVNGFTTGTPAVAVSRTPVAQFTVANATLIGNVGASPSNATCSGLNIRDQAAPRFVNSIVVNMTSQTTGANTNGLLEIDNRTPIGVTTVASTTTNMFATEIAYLKGVSFYSAAGINTVAGWVANGSSDAAMEAKLGDLKFANSFNNNPGFANLPTGGTLPAGQLFDPKPTTADSAVYDDDFVGANASYVAVPYRGAFDGGELTLWTADWSAADVYQLLVK